MVEEKTKLRIRRFIRVLVVVFCLAYGYAFLISTMTDSYDLDECKALADLVESSQPIPESISVPGHPALGCNVEIRGLLFRRFDHVRVYGVIDAGKQDSIFLTLQKARQQNKIKPVLLEFYDRENWRTWSNPATGNSGGDRGPETAIRKVRIE
jgi:hypothetical protein